MIEVVSDVIIIGCEIGLIWLLLKDLKRIAEIEAKVKNLQQRMWVMECKRNVHEVMEDDGK